MKSLAVSAPLMAFHLVAQAETPGPIGGAPGFFKRPAAPTVNSTDFEKNERWAVGSLQVVDWSWTKDLPSYDIYLVNERYEPHSWNITPDAFLDTADMFYLYIVKSPGNWADGFASRFVNISEAGEGSLGGVGGQSGAANASGGTVGGTSSLPVLPTVGAGAAAVVHGAGGGLGLGIWLLVLVGALVGL